MHHAPFREWQQCDCDSHVVLRGKCAFVEVIVHIRLRFAWNAFITCVHQILFSHIQHSLLLWIAEEITGTAHLFLVPVIRFMFASSLCSHSWQSFEKRSIYLSISKPNAIRIIPTKIDMIYHWLIDDSEIRKTMWSWLLAMGWPFWLIRLTFLSTDSHSDDSNALFATHIFGF